MMIPEFMRFYSYSVANAMDEFAVTFFSLINCMYRLQAKETMNDVVAVSTAMAGKEASSVMDELKKQERGLAGIVDEVRVIKK
jgi:hypothetical protein